MSTIIRTRLISIRLIDHSSSSYEINNLLWSSCYRKNYASCKVISLPNFYRKYSNWIRSTDHPVKCYQTTPQLNQKSSLFNHHVCSSIITTTTKPATRWFCVDKKPVSEKSSTQINEQKTNPIVDEEIPSEKLGIVAKFKLMYKQYWYILVPVHLITSTGWLIGFYYLSKSGVDIPSLLQTINVSESIIEKLKNSSMGHLAISYMCYKLMTPVRYMVTVGGTTLSIKYLSQWGYIRPVPSREQFRKMYDDKKAQIRKNYEDLHDKTATAINQAKKNPSK